MKHDVALYFSWVSVKQPTVLVRVPIIDVAISSLWPLLQLPSTDDSQRSWYLVAATGLRLCFEYHWSWICNQSRFLGYYYLHSLLALVFLHARHHNSQLLIAIMLVDLGQCQRCQGEDFAVLIHAYSLCPCELLNTCLLAKKQSMYWIFFPIVLIASQIALFALSI
jgi:hypothetical protein